MKNTFFSLIGLVICVFIGLSIKSCSSPPPSKVYRIGRDLNWYPGRAMGKQNNLLAFLDDLIFLVANEENLHVELTSSFASNLFKGLDNHAFDAIVSSVLPTPVSREDYVFSDPIFLLGPVLIVPKNSKIATLTEMENKIIGIRSGSSVVFDVERFPNIDIISYDNVLIALDSLTRGNIDGVILDLIPAQIYVTSLYKNQLKIVTDPLTKEGLRLVAVKNPEGTHFIEIFNKGLKEAKTSQAYNALLKKWGLFNFERYSEPGVTL